MLRKRNEEENMIKRVLALVLAAVMFAAVFSGCRRDSGFNDLGYDVGEIFEFGNYKDENIEWIIKERNFILGEDKVRLSLLSKYALDCKPFNDSGVSSWQNSSLRKWLNGDFYDEAFSESEKESIIEKPYFSSVGSYMELYSVEKVTLMDLYWYGVTVCEDYDICKPTKYAQEQGAKTEGGACSWWSRGFTSVLSNLNSEYFMLPTSFGINGQNYIFEEDPFTGDGIGVRPFITVEVDAGFDKKDINKGDKVTMGKFGEQPIEWIVLDNEDCLTLWSSEILTNDIFDDDSDSWEDSHMREYLNGDFYDAAFSKKEKKQMVEGTMYDDESQSIIEDKVFLLTQDDMSLLLNDMGQRYRLAGYAYNYVEKNRDVAWESYPDYWVLGSKASSFSYPYYSYKVDTLLGVKPVICVELR
ncbi:MAG: DUF6273 domain-containing protein [Clostridiales bacterium]|nr:DUF6273 domain-containing protein [Clostridiales bacterium]